MTSLELLKEMRRGAGPAQTKGLSDDNISHFLAKDPNIAGAIANAHQAFQTIKAEFPELISLPEAELIPRLQRDYLNFYATPAVNPYVALGAKGPWVVTAYGAVIHDSGGYGMLGFGHGPEEILAALSKDVVIANIMTPNFSQLRLAERLNREIGHTLAGAKRHPYAKYLCLNSGSEAMTVALRLADINAKAQTSKGGKHAGKSIKFLAQKGAFHGRTDRPAQASDSTRKASRSLASYQEDRLWTVTPNDIPGLKALFQRAAAEQVFFEAMLLEPVMGEGDPGKAIAPDFYAAARELCTENGTLLIVDSIQAGFRATGNLSIVDYPGFEGVNPPDMESYSKALNAGQYPLSVLALSAPIAAMYVAGAYGNTMTSNPRALEVAVAVLDGIDPNLRQNIRDRGTEFVAKFRMLKQEFPEVVTIVQGTGLLVSIGLVSKGFRVIGHGAVEDVMRKNGIGVIHGGENSLRFTPHFAITEAEVDLIIEEIRATLKAGPIYGDSAH